VHPDICVTKTADPTTAAVGGTITYTIEVCNCGDIALEGVTVVDSLLGDLSGSYADTLAVGACESHDFTRVILATDPNPLENCVVVHGNPLGPLTNDVTDEACAQVEITGGATRTPGFWQTHLEATTTVFNNYLGGTMNIGIKPINNINDLMGVFWASPAKYAQPYNGIIKRLPLSQARERLAFQAVAAVLNSAVPNGKPLPVTLAYIQSTMNGTDISAINALAGTLDTYNGSGESVALGIPQGSATPKAAQAIANLVFADWPPTP